MTVRDLYRELCSYKNLKLAYKKARKRKTQRDYVIDFERNLKENLLQLRSDLLFLSYKPRSLVTFILRDPKTRKISKSDFRDRIVHHALCNIIEPYFEKSFIHDSYANRIGKGTLNAIKRFDAFKRKVSKNNTSLCFLLKADIKQYFENVSHDILKTIIKKKISDKRVLWLINIILSNHVTKIKGKGMPLGNLTSQFFANIYLNELDQFVKHKLKAKYYIRYVDDFVILHNDKFILEQYKKEINKFLVNKLILELHQDKSKITILNKGVKFLGMRLFPTHKIIIKRNLRKFKKKLSKLKILLEEKKIEYDEFYDFLEGWCAYTSNADTYNYKKKILKDIEYIINKNISTKEYNRYLKKSK
jgi:retron-type reverse transcriptase